MSGRHRNGRAGGTPGNRTPGNAVSGGVGGRGVLPLGVQTFREVRGSGDYYVDKTVFARRMISEGKCYFLSRPRRFGKSLFVSMLKELFEGNEELFEGLFIHDRWDWSVRRPVVRIDFSGGHFMEPDGLRVDLNAQLEDIGSEFDLACAGADVSVRFRRLVRDLHQRSGRRVVVLVDEYDKPILDAIRAPDLARVNRDFLRGFYGCLKFSDEYLRFVFLTGVSKFSKVSLFSGLNNLEDITMNPAYSSVCGFTETDLDRVFTAELQGLDRSLVREWYNGYSWLGAEKVYNPYDVLTLLRQREFRPHWFETASPTFLLDTLIERGVPTPTLTGTVSRDRLLSSFDVDRIGTEALLFQTGYLTITGEHDNDGDVTYQLDYPNREVRQSLNRNLLIELVDGPAADQAKRTPLLKLLHRGDTTGLCELFKEFFANIPHQWHNRGRLSEYEAYYASVFYTYFAACGLEVTVEDATNLGRVDMTIRTPQRIWLFEFKTTRHTPTNTTHTAAHTAAHAAIQQIQNRGYADKYRTHGLPITLVGIEFDTKTRNITNYQTTTT